MDRLMECAKSRDEAPVLREWHFRLASSVLLAVAMPELGGIRLHFGFGSSVYWITLLAAAVSWYLEGDLLNFVGYRAHRRARGRGSELGISTLFIAATLAWLVATTGLRFVLWFYAVDLPVDWVGVRHGCLLLVTASMVMAQIYLAMYMQAGLVLAAVRTQGFRAEQSKTQLAFHAYRQAPESILGGLRALRRLIGDDPEAALRCARDLAAVHRYMLRGAWRELVPLGDELDLLNCHARLLEVRFGVPINLETDLTEAARRSFLIVPVSLHLILENALIFGHLQSTGESRKRVGMELQGRRLRLIYAWRAAPLTAQEALRLETLCDRVAAIVGERPEIQRTATQISVSLPLYPL